MQGIRPFSPGNPFPLAPSTVSYFSPFYSVIPKGSWGKQFGSVGRDPPFLFLALFLVFWVASHLDPRSSVWHGHPGVDVFAGSNIITFTPFLCVCVFVISFSFLPVCYCLGDDFSYPPCSLAVYRRRLPITVGPVFLPCACFLGDPCVFLSRRRRVIFAFLFPPGGPHPGLVGSPFPFFNEDRRTSSPISR